MLWGLWIWARYETPYKEFNDENVPFEPYSVVQDHILDNFLEIETDISEVSVKTFYSIYHFAEMINGYIEYYKSTYNEEMYLNSMNFNGNNAIDIRTEYKPNNRMYKIRQILCNLIDEKKIELFFQDKSAFDSWNNYYAMLSDIRKKLQNNEKNLLDLIKKDRDLVPKKEHFHLSSSLGGNMHQLRGDFYTVGEILGHSLKGIGNQLGIIGGLEAVTERYVDVRLERKRMVLESYHKALQKKIS
jgi:hypothetical protein